MEQIELIYLSNTDSKVFGRIILYNVNLDENLRPKEISHIKKYWSLKNKNLKKISENCDSTEQINPYIEYLDFEYKQYIEKIGLDMTNKNYPTNLYEFVNLGLI